ncbi:acyl-CoA dehydrogenase family protein [Peristeroidobacter soli]|uniref:acyl-CoA dehydrogenase family protein n=1 Tax=Peristeroidobacter soli TaxID=2497877 RepID=UPI00101C7972|nr:acyl-CoA dehydrogenase family protein [Peristeroidobacter soli]
MDFDFTDEQRLLKDSVESLLSDQYGFTQRKAAAAQPKGWSEPVWKQFADQGLLAAPFAEADGGIGAGPIETMIIMEALGRALCLEPYLTSIVVAGGFLRHGGTDAQRAAYVPSLIDGSKTMAFAQLEKHSRDDLNDVTSTAKRTGAGYILDGQKYVVWHGDSASTLVVTARTAGSHRDHKGIGAFLVPADAPGVTVKGYSTQDSMRAADISFAGVEVGPDAVIGNPENALPMIERVVDEARIALCCEAVGAMDEALKITVEYLKTRRQFGAAIGSFQALQHRAADMFVALEQARGIAMYAAMATELEPGERSKAVASAKVQIGRSARFIGQQSVQLHGGIGLTMEARIGHYFKRLTMIDSTFGDADFHLKRLAALGGPLAA